MIAGKLLVYREPSDALWNVVKGSFDKVGDEFEYPSDWIAEGVGSWERAMLIACEVVGLATCEACMTGARHP